MKRLLLILGTALSCASCGLFTNVPAQVHVENVTPGTIDYTIASATQSAVYKETQPTATIVGEPGSIGVTFTTMDVQYADPTNNLTPKPLDSKSVAPLELRFTVRVDSSNYPADPAAAQPIDQTKIGQQVNVGKTTITLPVITRQVETFGDQKLNYGDAGITAEVTLSGTDDAGFPASVQLDIPITFTGPQNQ
ncbi:MAG TPA: hypothetical protein V6D47_17155 [Oscillatoriaceae cyanobacterium]